MYCCVWAAEKRLISLFAYGLLATQVDVALVVKSVTASG